MSDPIEIVIEPSRSWVRIPWRDIYRYRDLLFLLVRRDFVAQYKQTVLGPLWFIIQPLLTTVVFTVIFGKVAGIPTDGVPPMLFYLCGMSVWSYFAGCLGSTSSTFLANAAIFGKVYFPRMIVPLSIVISKFVGFCIQLATFLAFLVYYKLFTEAGATIHLTPMLFALPLLLLQSAAIGLGVGLCMTSLTAKYRDFAFLGGFLTQLWMYVTPVVYPLSVVPGRWQWVCSLNPMTPVVESFRVAFLGVGTVSAVLVGISLISTLLVLVAGLLLFSRSERTFIDTV